MGSITGHKPAELDYWLDRKQNLFFNVVQNKAVWLTAPCSPFRGWGGFSFLHYRPAFGIKFQEMDHQLGLSLVVLVVAMTVHHCFIAKGIH